MNGQRARKVILMITKCNHDTDKEICDSCQKDNNTARIQDENKAQAEEIEYWKNKYTVLSEQYHNMFEAAQPQGGGDENI